jgi:hypothetical protein
MSCEKCGGEMTFQYDVEERSILFVLWDCSCGHKLLERRPQQKAGTGATSSVGVAVLDD